MSGASSNAASYRRRLLGVGALAGALAALMIALGAPGGGGVNASGQGPLEKDHFFTEAAVPANDVMMFGVSPREAANETWAIGKAGQGAPNYVILRYASGAGWTRAPAIQNGSGQPLEGFAPATGVVAGQMTPDGSGALVGTAGKTQVLLVRNPGQPFEETSPELVPEEASEALLRGGETLFARRAPLVAALEEGSAAGALVVPGEASSAVHPEAAVLHWEGSARRWTREAVNLPAGHLVSEFQPVAIAASSGANAWLLAQLSAGSEAVSLFRRKPAAEGSPASWQPVSPGEGLTAGAPLMVGGEPVSHEPETTAQALTVTENGVWVDGERPGAKSVTLFFEPSGAEADAGKVLGSWCAEPCPYTLPGPEELPGGEYRSFAWAGSPGQFGERVITGFPDGAILRLVGTEFVQEATVGEPAAPDDVGGSKGAAFSSAYEGWLGDEALAVHASLEEAPDRLEYWPAPFHRPLLAIAPQPGAPVGAITSEALAVGENGEVARFIPGQGWEPETLFEVSGRHGEPQLHGVAWPTPNRAYAIGARGEQLGVVGEMWLWRGETGLWEPDPAAPVDLRANLLGIAFAPGNPSRGYVVGQGGTLLRYGKTWTQEPTCQPGVAQPCIPPEVAGASFTAVAFAGSEALVAYRVPHFKEGAVSYTAGVLANDGAGWQIDSELASALPPRYAPWTVAGLPDGGAALSAAVPGGLQEPLVLEHNGPGSGWQATPQPFPGFAAPASLALFREGGALRAVGSGAIPDTLEADSQTPPPAGFPPTLTTPYPLGLATGVVRQTASGWNDEEHQRGILRAPAGGYFHWDIPYEPDPTAAILLSEGGSAGWAVGGAHAANARAGSETADIARYPADGSPKAGSGCSSIPLKNEAERASKSLRECEHGSETGHATFAVGGGGQCAAPCAELANARIGPDQWLRHALENAKEVQGLRAFLDTGSRVSTGAAVHPNAALPYQRELERYASLLAGGPTPTLVAASNFDLEPGNPCTFQAALGAFSITSGLPELTLGVPEPCPAGSAPAPYYAFTSTGAPGTPAVRVVVLDDSGRVPAAAHGGVDEAQEAWLKEQLEEANRSSLPALVVGNADLTKEDDEHQTGAERLTSTLVEGGAAAYVFDSPEQNISTALTSGSHSLPAFGSGTLGYVNAVTSEQSDFIGASGFLLVEVGAYAANGKTAVNARLIPDIEELSLDAHKGVLLRRSEAALFSALARRPRAGGVGSGASAENESSSFIPIPANCQGGHCAEGILPEYSFTSENPKIGNFIKPNLRGGGAEEPELVNEKPVPNSESGLFCAFNGGTTKVKIEAGGLSASVLVRVQEGSVRRPCGTTPIEKPPLTAHEQAVTPPLEPSGAASPAGSPLAPLVPVPPPPAAVAAPPAPRTPTPPFLLPAVPTLPLAVLVPPPLPPAAEPTPPSGTSAVTSPVEAAQKEEEQEEATESASVSATAYHQSEHEPSPLYLIGLIVLAAFAGATITRRPRRGEREVRVAPASLTTINSQRQLARRHRRRW